MTGCAGGFEIVNWIDAPDHVGLDAQVDAIMSAIEARLAPYGVGLECMVKHTIMFHAGAVDPLEAIGAVHRVCHARAPQLVPRPGVGTIFGSSAMAHDGALIAFFGIFRLDRPCMESARRLLFHEMPIDVAKGIQPDGQLFLTGLEGLEFVPERAVSPAFDRQADVVADKVVSVLDAFGRQVEDLQWLNVYLKTELDDMAVLAALGSAFARAAGRAVTLPNAIRFIRGRGMAIPAFMIEVDGYTRSAGGNGPVLHFARVEEESEPDAGAHGRGWHMGTTLAGELMARGAGEVLSVTLFAHAASDAAHARELAAGMEAALRAAGRVMAHSAPVVGVVLHGARRISADAIFTLRQKEDGNG